MQAKKFVMMAMIPLALTMGGCVISIDGDGDGHHSSWEDREYENRKTISNLNLDLSHSQVTSMLGVPDFTEFHKSDDGSYMVLFYRTHRKKGDGVTTKDECTPVVFKDDKLVGWGEASYLKI